MNKLPKTISYKDKYGPAMEIQDQAAADEMFERLVEHTMSFGQSRQEAARIERANLGYYAGYYSQETRLRVERLYSCVHPVLGPAQIQRTPEEIFQLGYQIGRGEASPIKTWEDNQPD